MRKDLTRLSPVCLAALAILFAFISARAQDPPSPAGKTAAQEYKNIQILKDIPADQLIPAMQFMSASLGVECEYCHVERAFDKDDKKEKGFARHMMEMVMNINKDNFEGKRWVTCYSCHRGAPKPVSVPIIFAEEKIPLKTASETADKSAFPKPEALFDKYLAAVGGADALKKITSRVQKGIVTISGNQKMPIEIYSKGPNMRVSTVHRKDMDSVTGFDGKTGWMSVPGRVRPMTAQESEGAGMDADLAFPAHVSTMFTKLEVEQGENVDGRPTWLVVGEREGKPPVKLFFDQQSGLLLRLIRYTDSPLGLNPLQIEFADYRDSGGVKIPFRWMQSRPGNRFTIQVESSQHNVAIDDSKFASPPATSAPPPAH